MGGLGDVLTRVACLRGWHARVDDVGGVLALVVWVACLRGWRASMDGVLTWIT